MEGFERKISMRPFQAEVWEASYPEDLRVMAIDGNPVSLSILVAMLRKCMYRVSAYVKATEALEELRQYKYDFDIVVTAMVGIDMDGLSLLKIIDSELDIPVIVTSASDDQQFITRAILHGARGILKKPVCVRVLQNIWQHAVRKQLLEQKNYGQTYYDDFVGKKRPLWSAELHSIFIDAVRQLGINSAQPMAVLEIMNVNELTLRSVTNHLHRFRDKLKKHDVAWNQGDWSKVDWRINPKKTYGVQSTRPLPNQEYWPYRPSSSGSSSRPIDHPYEFSSDGEGSSSRNQTAHSENKVGNLSPVLKSNNAQFEYQLLEKSQDYFDDELTALISQFGAERPPGL